MRLRRPVSPWRFPFFTICQEWNEKGKKPLLRRRKSSSARASSGLLRRIRTSLQLRKASIRFFGLRAPRVVLLRRPPRKTGYLLRRQPEDPTARSSHVGGASLRSAPRTRSLLRTLAQGFATLRPDLPRRSGRERGLSAA